MEDAKKKPQNAVDEINKTLGEVKAALAEIKEKGGGVSEEVETRFKAITDELESVKKKTVERQLSVPGLEDEKKKFDLALAVKAARTGNWSEAGHEAEVIKATHEKAMKVGFQPDNPAILQKDILASSGAAGGFLLPVETDTDIVPLALAKRPILEEMGITKLNGLSAGEYRINKQTARGTAYWVGELQAPSKSTQTFDQRILRMKKVAAYSAVSNDILRQGRNESMSSFVADDLAKALGLALETALISGSGTNFTPKGITQYSGLTSTGGITAGNQFGIRDAARMAHAIEAADLLEGNLGFVTHPDVMLGMRIQGAETYSGQTTNTPSLVPGMPILSNAKIEELTGYKWRTTTQFPTDQGSSGTDSHVLFGDFSQVVLGMWGGLEVKISDQASDGTNNMFVQDGFFVHVLQTADIVVRDEAALTYVTVDRTSLGETV